MAIFKVNLEGHGRNITEVIDTENLPSTLGSFYAWFTRELLINPKLFVQGEIDLFQNGEVEYEYEIVEVTGPLFSPGTEYEADEGRRKAGILARNGDLKLGFTYMIKADTIYFNIAEKDVLQYLLSGKKMESKL